MKKKTVKFGVLSLVLGILSCTSGGGGSTDGSRFASGALVQFLPYEIVRDNLVEALSIQQANGNSGNPNALQLLADNADLFGAANEETGTRSLDYSMARIQVWKRIADMACREGIRDNLNVLFPEDPLSPETIGPRILSKPLNDTYRDAVADVLALEGYTSTTEKQHAICNLFLNLLEVQIK